MTKQPKEVLIAVASKHGSTWQIGEAIARNLDEYGLCAHAVRIEQATCAANYDAVILGSAIYGGNWLKSARLFALDHVSQLVARPTWLFSSGPLGDPPMPGNVEAVQIDEIIAKIKPVEHRIFAGKLDKAKLNFAERAISRALHAPEGDFRNWDAINTWAKGIADNLKQP